MQYVRQLVYTMFISNSRTIFHLWWKENLVKHEKVSKYYEDDCRSNKGFRAQWNNTFWISQCFQIQNQKMGTWRMYMQNKQNISWGGGVYNNMKWNYKLSLLSLYTSALLFPTNIKQLCVAIEYCVLSFFWM